MPASDSDELRQSAAAATDPGHKLPALAAAPAVAAPKDSRAQLPSGITATAVARTMQPPFISTHSAVAAARHGPAQWAGRRSEPAVPNVKLNDGRRPLAAQATQAASQQTDAPSGNDARQPSNWQSSQADLSSPDDGGRQLADDDLGSPTHTAPTIGDTTHAEIRAATTRVVEALNRARAERIQRERSQDLSESYTPPSSPEQSALQSTGMAQRPQLGNGAATEDYNEDAAESDEEGPQNRGIGDWRSQAPHAGRLTSASAFAGAQAAENHSTGSGTVRHAEQATRSRAGPGAAEHAQQQRRAAAQISSGDEVSLNQGTYSDDEMIDVVNGDEAEEGADANGSADRDQEADAAGEEEIGEDTGLATNEIPEGEEDVGPVTEAAVREAIAGTDVVAIICNGNKGRLVVDDSTVVCLCRGCQTKARRQGKPWVEMTPTEFEKHSGMGASKKWRYTVKVDDGTPGGGQSIGAFLEKRGVPPEAKGLKPGRRKKRKYGFHTRGAPGSQLPSRSATPPLEAMLALGEDLDPTLTSTGEHWLQTSTEKGHQVNEVKAVMREGPEFQAVISPMLPAKKTSEAEEALAGLPGPTELEALALAAGREREEAMKLPPDAIMDPVALKRMSSQPLLLERGQRTRRKPQWLNNLSAIRQKRSIRTALSRGTSMHPNGRRGSRPLDADSDSSEDALPRWGRMPAKRIRSETRLSDDEMGVPPKRMRSMHDLGSLGPQVPVSRALSSLLAGRGGGRGRRLGLAGAPRPASSDAALAAAGDEMRDVSLQPSISSWQPVGGAGSVLQVSIMYKGRMFSGTLTQQARSKRGLTSPYAPGVLSSRASPSPHNPPALELLAAASDALGAHLDDELDVLPRRPYGSRRTGEAQPASRPLSREASVDLSEDPTNGWAEAPSEEDTWEVQGARGAAPASTTAATVGNPERRAAAEREYQRLEASGAPEGTRCALCHRGVEPGVPNTASVASPGRKGQGLGGLVLLRVSAIQHAWVHDQCAWWSPEVYGREGKLYGVPEAVRRGRMIKCRVCGQKGATLGCHMRNCRPSFHLPCARENGCLLQMDPYQVTCTHHLEGQETGAAASPVKPRQASFQEAFKRLQPGLPAASPVKQASMQRQPLQQAPKPEPRQQAPEPEPGQQAPQRDPAPAAEQAEQGRAAERPTDSPRRERWPQQWPAKAARYSPQQAAGDLRPGDIPAGSRLRDLGPYGYPPELAGDRQARGSRKFNSRFNGDPAAPRPSMLPGYDADPSRPYADEDDGRGYQPHPGVGVPARRRRTDADIRAAAAQPVSCDGGAGGYHSGREVPGPAGAAGRHPSSAAHHSEADQRSGHYAPLPGRASVPVARGGHGGGSRAGEFRMSDRDGDLRGAEGRPRHPGAGHHPRQAQPPGSQGHLEGRRGPLPSVASEGREIWHTAGLAALKHPAGRPAGASQALNQAMRSGEMLREHLGREVQPGELAPQPHSKVASANIGDILHAHIRNIRGGAEAGAQHSAQHSGPPANVPSWRDPRNPQPAGGAPFVRPSLQRHPSAPLPASSHAAQYPYVQPAPPQPSLEPQPSWNSSDEEDADTARQASLGMPIVEQHAPSGYASDGDMNALVNAQMPASHPLPSRPYQPGYGPPADSRPRFYEQQPGAAARRLNGGAGDLRSDPRSDPRTAGRGPGGPSRVPSGPIRAGPAPLSRPSTAGQQSGELPSDDETRSDMGGGNVSPQLATALSALTPSPMTLDAEKLMEAINSGQLVKSALDPDMAVVDSLLQSLLGGTVGKSSHRPGRCAVCVVQRKGKCGTESAPRKCLRKQALIKCGIFVETNNPRARYVQGQPGAGLSEIAAAAAAAAARAATAKREPSALERDARLAREAEIRQQRLQLDRQLMQQQQAAQAQAGSQAGLWPGSAQPRVGQEQGVKTEAPGLQGPSGQADMTRPRPQQQPWQGQSGQPGGEGRSASGQPPAARPASGPVNGGSAGAGGGRANAGGGPARGAGGGGANAGGGPAGGAGPPVSYAPPPLKPSFNALLPIPPAGFHRSAIPIVTGQAAAERAKGSGSGPTSSAPHRPPGASALAPASGFVPAPVERAKGSGWEPSKPVFGKVGARSGSAAGKPSASLAAASGAAAAPSSKLAGQDRPAASAAASDGPNERPQQVTGNSGRPSAPPSDRSSTAPRTFAPPAVPTSSASQPGSAPPPV